MRGPTDSSALHLAVYMTDECAATNLRMCGCIKSIKPTIEDDLNTRDCAILHYLLGSSLCIKRRKESLL